MIRLGFLVLTAAVLVVTSAAAHDHWINVGRYRSPQDGARAVARATASWFRKQAFA